jgi:hypothetical protein
MVLNYFNTGLTFTVGLRAAGVDIKLETCHNGFLFHVLVLLFAGRL